MKIRASIISLICLLTFGAFAGMAQTVTCTFQFTASGTLGTKAFTNAAVTITTVGKTANITSTPAANIPNPPLDYLLSNDTTNIFISGLGTVQPLGTTFINLFNIVGGQQALFFSVPLRKV